VSDIRQTRRRACSASASASGAIHVHSVGCGTPSELELPAPLYDLSVAASLIPGTKKKLKRFLHDPSRHHLYPARYRLDTEQNARVRGRIRVLYASEIKAARQHLLRKSGLGLLAQV
jgi:hypothetical protein